MDPQTRARIHRIAAEQDIGHFLREHDRRLSDNLLCLIIHERAALTMCTYEPMIIPGLLQTEAYARAVTNADGTSTSDEHEFDLAARMDRQSMLSVVRSPESVFYIHEIALQAVVGNGRIMHDQMMRLAFMCEWERLSPRVIPLASTGHPHLVHSFTLMTFARPVKPVAYSETDVVTVFSEEERSIKVFERKRKLLADLALSAEQSRSVFARWADFYDRRGDRDDDGADLAQEHLQRPRAEQLRRDRMA